LELGLGAGYVKSEYERAACARRPRRSANVDCLSPHNLKVVGANPTAQPIVEHEFRSRVSSPRTELDLEVAMLTNDPTNARKLRSSLSHPIIDADGHWLEYAPLMREEFRRIGGDAAAEALALASDRIPSSLRMSLAERRRRRVGQEAFWGSPCENVLDRATAMLPRFLYERLDDLGIDFCVVYPTAGLGYHRLQDTRLRRAICRAYNVFTADQFRGLDDRVIPAAIIPMYTPEEAIEELEFAARQLGYRVMMVGGCMLYADLVGHWEKRNRQAIEKTNPNKLDHTALLQFAQKYGRNAVVEAVRRGEGLEGDSNSTLTGGIEDLDDYFRCKIERRED